MKQFNLFLCLIVLSMVSGPAAFASEPGRAILWELESTNLDYYYDNTISRTDRIAYLEKPRKLILRQEIFPSSGYDEKKNSRSLATGNARVWIRNPDGEISEVTLPWDKKRESVSLNLPSDLNADDVTGNYLVGVHLDAGVLDFDFDGIDEKVHLYSNCLVRYYRKDGTEGKNPDMFFKSPDKVALEIGPYIPEKIFRKSAGCPLPSSIRSGSDMGYVRDVSQSPLKKQQMKVFYKGSPLADAQIFILSKSGWRKTVMTDSEGVISVIPPKTHATMMDPAQFRIRNKKISAHRSEVEEGNKKYRHDREHKAGNNGKTYRGRYRAEDRLLYMVAYKDPATGEYHCATLPMTLRMWSQRGIWLSRAKGFGFWGIIGASLGVVGVTGGVYRKRKRARESILKSNPGYDR
jgi:hypothetical protein